MMETLDITQGTQEWHAVRAEHFTASEAPAMMGASPYKTRADLLREKATGARDEPSAGARHLFARGHAAEAAARALAEEILGAELYPVTGRDGRYLASLDGITMDGTTIWEHKLANRDLVASVAAGTVPDHHAWQLEHQILVSGAERALFSVSNGTAETHVYTWYDPDPQRRAALLAGWEQFAADLEQYRPETPDSAATAPAQERLPALLIDIAGEVRSSNLAHFSSAAIARIDAIRTDLSTDEDFAEAESIVTFLAKAEKEIDAAKAHALAQTASIDDLFRAVDALRESMRSKRLELDKLVKARKVAIRAEIIEAGADRVREHLASINAGIARAPVRFNPIPSLQAAAKSKRSLKGLRDAIDQAVADAKIETSACAARVAENLAAFDADADGYTALFHDLADLAQKDPEDFIARVRERIAAAKAEEQRREEAKKAEHPAPIKATPEDTPLAVTRAPHAERQGDLVRVRVMGLDFTLDTRIANELAADILTALGDAE